MIFWLWVVAAVWINTPDEEEANQPAPKKPNCKIGEWDE
jgi:hypothetical protein